MSEALDPYGPAGTLDFKGHAIRYLTIHSLPWYCAADLCSALGYGPKALEVLDRPTFPSYLTTVCDELHDAEIEGEPERLVLLSPVAAWRWTCDTDPGRGQALAAWTKREAIRLCPTAALDNPYVYLTLTPEGWLPGPRPERYSGRLAEYEALRWSDEYLERDFACRRGLPYPKRHTT